MNLPRVLTIMGSGETAPTMVSTHRALVARLPQPVQAVVLDTPYGFQENAPELATRAVEYFRQSVNIEIAVAGLLRLHDTHLPADPVAVERGLRAVAHADYLFAGPGSPTYALRQWTGTQIASIIRTKLHDGGIVTFASAAALTLGVSTVPVYEIYKVGADVSILPGLNILAEVGINATVIPHYDNAEGGHHDTRFCYLGETRLRLFETLLDPETYVLGVDEHTALVLDLDAGTAHVQGKGGVTVRCRDTSTVFASGSTLEIAYLQDPWSHSGGHPSGSTSASHVPDSTATASAPANQDIGDDLSLDATLTRLVDAFERALSARLADDAVRAALELEQALHDWSADTLQSDVRDRARAALRSMISALGEAATTGVRDPREVYAPFVEAMLEVRAVVRAEKRYDLSDIIRDSFTRIGVEVRDTAQGVEWELHIAQM